MSGEARHALEDCVAVIEVTTPTETPAGTGREFHRSDEIGPDVNLAPLCGERDRHYGIYWAPGFDYDDIQGQRKEFSGTIERIGVSILYAPRTLRLDLDACIGEDLLLLLKALSDPANYGTLAGRSVIARREVVGRDVEYFPGNGAALHLTITVWLTPSWS